MWVAKWSLKTDLIEEIVVKEVDSCCDDAGTAEQSRGEQQKQFCC